MKSKMDKNIQNKQNLTYSGVCAAKKLRRNLTDVNYDSLNRKFVKLNIEKASNNVDRKKLNIFKKFVRLR